MLNHSFLLETGRWSLMGNWLERQQQPSPFSGSVNVSWSEQNWFTMVMQLSFHDPTKEEIICRYRGHFHGEFAQYTYVLKQSFLGRIEGEGWVGPSSIVQRYWVIGDRLRRGGFETFYRVDPSTYHFSGAIFTGHSLSSTVEADLQRLG